MAPLKPFLLVTGLATALSNCTGDSCEAGDQTALLQSHLSRKSDLSLSQASDTFFPKLSHLNDPKTRKTALLEMEKTAVDLANMDKTQATQVVITVCTETAELLNTTVLYSIIEEDAADRASLDAAYDGFAEWETQRQLAEDQLDAAEAVVTSRAAALAFCRQQEIETCVNETICTTTIDQDCHDRDRLEEELQLIDEEIHRSWCEEGAIRTHTEFRQTTVSVFHRYTLKWTELEIAQGLCDEATEHCSTTTQSYIDQAIQCNAKQSEVQMASCEYHHVASGALAAYQQGFLAALSFYNDVVARVMILEADRKVEWDVLTRVICLLLTLTNEGDGVVSSDETAARIERCWTDDVDTSHLDIDYRDPPDMLSLPELPPLPCEADHIGGVIIGPPAECAALITEHNTQSTSQCSCLADELSNQGLLLGFFLLVDPAIEITVTGDSWSVQEDDMVFVGQLSAIHAQDFSALSAEMLTDAELDSTSRDYVGPVAKIAWAYASQQVADAALVPLPGATREAPPPSSLIQRFIGHGGLLFLNADDQVIDVRELASSSGPLGQPVSSTLSFSSAEEITDEQANAACPSMQPVTNSRHYAQGARDYCWIMGSLGLPQCSNGCFLYNTVTGKVPFPVIDGMHVFHEQTLQMRVETHRH